MSDDTKGWDGKKERRKDYMDNGYEGAEFDNGFREEEGHVVKRVTIVSLYRKMEQLTEAVSKLCKKVTYIKDIEGKQESLEKLLEEHLKFCRDFRAEKNQAQAEQETYRKGYNEAMESAEKQVKEKFKQNMTFWGKIIIPITAILFGFIYWLLDVLVL